MAKEKEVPAKSQEPAKDTEDKKSPVPDQEVLRSFDETLDPTLSTTVDENGNEQLITIPEDKLPPVYIDGEPHFIIRGKYVPYDDGRVVFQERLVNLEIKKLDYLKRLADHNKRLKALADEECRISKEAADKERRSEDERLRKKHDEEMKNIQTF
jgi:hypothetical protein